MLYIYYFYVYFYSFLNIYILIVWIMCLSFKNNYKYELYVRIKECILCDD